MNFKLKSMMMAGTCAMALVTGTNVMAWGSSWTVGNTTYHNFGGITGSSWNVGNTTYHNIGGLTGSSWRVGNTTYHSGSLFRGQTEQTAKKLFADEDFVKKADVAALQNAIMTRDVEAMASCAWDLKGLELILGKKDKTTTSDMIFAAAAQLAVEQGNGSALKQIIALAPECKKFEALLALKGKTRGAGKTSVTALPQLRMLPMKDWDKALKGFQPWEQPMLGRYICASFRGMSNQSADTASMLVNEGRMTMNPQMIAMGALELSKYPYDSKLGLKFEPAQIFAEATELAIVKQDKGALTQIAALYGTANFKNADYEKYMQSEIAMLGQSRGSSDDDKVGRAVALGVATFLFALAGAL